MVVSEAFTDEFEAYKITIMKDLIEEIGREIVGKVYKANWKRSGTCVALNLNNYTAKEIIHEVSNKGV